MICRLIVPVPVVCFRLAALIKLFAVRVLALKIVRLPNGLVPPTLSVNVIFPLPDVRLRLAELPFPLSVLLNVISLPFVVKNVSPFRRVGALNSIEPFVVATSPAKFSGFALLS